MIRCFGCKQDFSSYRALSLYDDCRAGAYEVREGGR